MKHHIFFITILLLGTWLSACRDDQDSELSNPSLEAVRQQLDTIAAFLAANNITAQLDSNQLYYYQTLTENASAPAPVTGNIVDFYYTLQTLDGQLIDQAIEGEDPPAKAAIRGDLLKVPVALELLLRRMHEEEEYEFFLPAANAYQNYEKDGLIPRNAIVRARIRLAQVLTPEQQKVQEDLLIRDYITARGLDLTAAQELDSGVYYIPTQPSDSTSLAEARAVNLYYKGTLLDSTDFSFDSNLDNDSPSEFSLGSNIPGFDIGLRAMAIGEEGIIIIPSHMAYGAGPTILPRSIIDDLVVNGVEGLLTRDIVIPPFAPLRFDVEVVSAY